MIHFSADEALRQILPPGVPILTAFESVGHIAHLNLKSVHLPYKYDIGRIIMDVCNVCYFALNSDVLMKVMFAEKP